MLNVAITPYREWLGGRTPSPTLHRQWQQAMKIHSSPLPPLGASRSTGFPPDSFYGSGGRRSGSSSSPPPRTTPDTPPYTGSGTRPSPGGPIPDTPPAPDAPSADRGSGGSSSGGRGTSGGGGGSRPTSLSTRPTGSGPSFGGGGRSGFGAAPGGSGRAGGGRTGSFGSTSGPSGFGETRAPVGAGTTSAAGKGAGTAAKGASAWSKAGTVVGKALNSPAGKIARWAGKKVLLPLAGAKAAGDLWGAFEPGIDTLRYGHKLPWKDGVGGRDNRVNDLLGNISPLEAIKEGKTQEVLSSLTGGLSDKALKAVFPWRERPRPAPAATRPATPATTRPTRPSAPAPQQPGSLRGISEQARGQSKAVRNPDDYLGSAFDATLRKGIDTGRNYLQNQMNKDGLDSETQSRIMAKYNDKIAGDKELSKASNKNGIVQTIEAKDAGRGERTLAAYRQQSPQGTYGKGAKYAEIQRKLVK